MKKRILTWLLAVLTVCSILPSAVWAGDGQDMPAAPTTKLANDSNGKPLITWTAVGGAAQYEVFRSATGAARSFSIVRRTSLLSWTDPNTEAGKTYYYVVRGINGTTTGKFCPAQHIQCGAPAAALGSPSMTLKTDTSSGKPAISWTKVGGAAQYEVFRSATGVARSFSIVRRTSLLSWTDPNAEAGKTYYYVVRAINGTTTGKFCPAQYIQCGAPAAALSSPSMTLKTDTSSGKPAISWTKVGGAAQYEVFRSATGVARSFSIVRRTSLLSWTDPNAEAGKTYYYVVRAINGTTTGKFCPAQSIVPAYSLIDSGSCGDNVTWELFSNGTLVISGTGPMYDYDIVTYGGLNTPWRSYLGSIQQAVIHPGVTSIGSRALEDCENLTSVSIPDSVTSIGDFAFGFCSNLTDITIPSCVASIGASAFVCCKSLTSITIPYGVTALSERLFSSCEHLTDVVIPSSVSSIGSDAFYSCKSLTSITIPRSVTSIGSSAFSFCSNLTDITIPDRVTRIDSAAFRGCESLTNIVIPYGVTSIEMYTFENCGSLVSVTLPNSVTEIKERAFYACENLTSISIPSSITRLGNEVFLRCSNLTSAVIPAGIPYISYGLFSGCSSLASIAIPGSVKSVSSYAFDNCDSLKTVYFGGNEDDWVRLIRYNTGIRNDELCYSDNTVFYDQTEPWG